MPDTDLSTLLNGGDCQKHYHRSDRFPSRDTLLWLESLETVTHVDGDYTITNTNDLIQTFGIGNINIILPVARGGRKLYFKRLGSGTLTLIPNASETVDEQSSYTVEDSVTLKAINGGWITFGNSMIPSDVEKVVTNTFPEMELTTGPLLFTGTAYVPYGSMYCEDTSINVSLTAAHTYARISSGLSDGGTSDSFTFQNARELKCNVAGIYLVNWSLSISHSVSDVTIEGGVLVNSVVQDNTANATRAKENGVVYSVGGTGIITLAVDDLVSLGVERESAGTSTITVNHANLSIIMIGGV